MGEEWKKDRSEEWCERDEVEECRSKYGRLRIIGNRRIDKKEDENKEQMGNEEYRKWEEKKPKHQNMDREENERG